MPERGRFRRSRLAKLNTLCRSVALLHTFLALF
jgi:hypothetical protein